MNYKINPLPLCITLSILPITISAYQLTGNPLLILFSAFIFLPILCQLVQINLDKLDCLFLTILLLMSIIAITKQVFNLTPEHIGIGILSSLVFVISRRISNDAFIQIFSWGLGLFLILNDYHAIINILNHGMTSRITAAFGSPLSLGVFCSFAIYAAFLIAEKHLVLSWFYAFNSFILLVLAQAKWSSLCVTALLFALLLIKLGRKDQPINIFSKKFLILNLSLKLFLQTTFISLIVYGSLCFLYKSSSSSIKPAAMITFFKNIALHPYILLIGDVSQTKQIYYQLMTANTLIPGGSSHVVESWILEMISDYGIISLLWLSICILPLFTTQWKRYTLAHIAIISVLSSSFFSTGGASPPTSLFLFSLSGFLIGKKLTAPENFNDEKHN